MELRNQRVVAVFGAAAMVVVLGSVTAVAATQITSAQIKDHTIQVRDLSPTTVRALRSGQPVRVRNLSGAFDTIAPDVVKMTNDGVRFVVADGANNGGSLRYSGLNGHKLSDVKNLVYVARYLEDNPGSGGVAAPYLRIFTKKSRTGADHSSIFSPNTQSPDGDFAAGPFHEWVTTSGSWRYDDDPGANPAGEMSFAKLLKAHGNERISYIRITTGFGGGTNVKALLRRMEINHTKYDFGH